MTEPGAGSDVSGIKTKAVQYGDEVSHGKQKLENNRSHFKNNFFIVHVFVWMSKMEKEFLLLLIKCVKTIVGKSYIFCEKSSAVFGESDTFFVPYLFLYNLGQLS